MQAFLGRPWAVCCLRGNAGDRVTGTVRFYRRREGTLVTVEVRGLPQTDSGFFALHIHEKGDCRGEGFSNTGGHYDPLGAEHPCHAGDLPPLLNANGRAFLAVFTARFRPEEVLGRSVVIHSHPDDFRTQPSGGAGSKIACGVIRKV